MDPRVKPRNKSGDGGDGCGFCHRRTTDRPSRCPGRAPGVPAGAAALAVRRATPGRDRRLLRPAQAPPTRPVERGVMRERTEETGLTRDDVTVGRGWHAVLVGPRIALMKAMDSAKPAAALRSHIADYLRSQATPELADIRIVRGVADLDPKMPRFIVAYLSAMWT